MTNPSFLTARDAADLDALVADIEARTGTQFVPAIGGFTFTTGGSSSNDGGSSWSSSSDSRSSFSGGGGSSGGGGASGRW